MKVFVVGGSGNVGREVVALLARSEVVTRITVAGRNLANAQEMAAAIGSKATAVRTDGADAHELARQLDGYDLVVNAATDDTVLPVLRAAIEAGAHYCDPNAVIEEAVNLTGEADAAGITAIVANGIGPGLSNLMGVHVAGRLDEVDQLQRGMAGLIGFDPMTELTSRHWIEDPNGSRAVLHEFGPFMTWVLQMMQEMPSPLMLEYEQGRWVEVHPIRHGVDVPSDRGTVFTYPYVSCESFWRGIPTGFGEVPPVEMWFSTLPPRANTVLRDQALHLLDGDLDPETAVGAFFDVVDEDPQQWLAVADDFTPVPMLWLRAVGHKDGRPARCDCWLPDSVSTVGGWFLTSAALVAAALKVLRGETARRGVMTAEQAFDSVSFFDEVAALLPESPPEGRLLGESLHWLN